ncbi:MAG: tetratricopeptide repeat protein [Bacteroidales bacterium]|nr:tetratricopeptide repeat protein [Bacteroidales bacterium]
MNISIKKLFILFLLLPAIHGIAQEDARINTLLAEADGFINENKLNDALVKVQDVIEMAPSNIPALQKRINIYFLMNNEKESVRYVDEAIRKYPEVGEFHYLRGIINNERGKYIRALDDFNQAINLHSSGNLFRYYLGRGVSHMNLLEYDQALADFTASIEQNDTVASAYHSRAMLNYEMKDYSAAVEDFLKALTYSEGNSALYFNLGMSYYRLNEKEKACPYFHKSCTMGNTNACRMTLMECAKAIPVIP